MKSVEEVLLYIENYYSDKYNPVKKSAVLDFLKEYPAETVIKIIPIVLRNFSDRWGKSPGVAEFEDAIKELPAESRKTIYQIQKYESMRERCKIELPAPEDMPKFDDLENINVEDYVNLMERARSGELKKSAEYGFISEIVGESDE